ncbi:MAG: chemotaxis protein MotB [Clostridiales bacterium]|nr:chemotaxis protein MotB [Clostridiales bacterium]
MSRKKPEKKEISQGWLTTYSDMMTLILTFFVLLYSFSLVDSSKFRQLAQSMAIALGGDSQVITNGGNIGPVPSAENPGVEDNTEGSGLVGEEAQRIYEEVSTYVDENGLNAKVTIKRETRGVLIELQDNILFDSGKAALKQDSTPLLKKISGLLSQFSNEVIVEGHTDNLPINKGYYQSNWELSTDRANKVVRYFIEKEGMDGRRFQAVGLGEYRPIDTNDTPEGRQTNRRVNILIVTTQKNK